MTWTDPPLWVASARLYDYELNPHVRGNLLFLKECTALGAAEEVQIASGAAIITRSYIELEAESGTTDDLDTISTNRTGLGVGTIVVLRAKTGDTITVKHGTEIPIGNDVVLTGGNHLALVRGPAYWHLLSIGPPVASGTGTVANTTTAVNITHGLGQPPTRVLLTLTSSLGSASEIYVSNKDITANTEFQVTVDIDPGADVTFDWRAWVGEGI